MPLITTCGACTAQAYGFGHYIAPPSGPPSFIGQAYGGGYYAGSYMIDGEMYYLIISPKAQGLSTGAAWGDTISPFPTASVIDGYKNTFSNTATNPALMNWVKSLNINGYTDWYIPSRDEMQMIYWAFKSPNTANATGNLPAWVGEPTTPLGTVLAAVPPRPGYTSSVPAQTAIAAFQTGGAEDFRNPGGFWQNLRTSTSSSTNNLFMLSMAMSNGAFETSHTQGAANARAVRRMKAVAP